MARQRSLFLQLILFGALASATAILLFSIWVTRVQRNLEIRALESEVQLVADDVGNAAVHYMVIKDYWNLEQLIRQSAVNPGIMLLQVTTVDGRVIGQIQRDTVGSPPAMNYSVQKLNVPNEPGVTTRPDLNRVDVWRPIQADELMGWVHVEHELAESRLLQSHLWQDSLFTGLLVLLASALLLFFFLRKPIGLLRKASEFAARLPKSEGEQLGGISRTREIDSLILALNTASRHLKEQGDALARTRFQQERRSRIFEAMAMGEPPDQILTLITTGLEQDMPGCMASIMVKDKSGEHLNVAAAPSLPDFYLQAIEGLPVMEGMGSCGTAAARGERVVVEDIRHHPYWKDYIALAD
ncbi:MAG TPA: hypothetical protein VL968_10600, partial [Rhodocyclaceae bacterium]|nr:hypothetical protein [Rhodocyclaceae bacterium]